MVAKRFVLMLTLAAAFGCRSARADEINWRTDYDAAREEAAAKKLPLVLEITADYCTWCRKLEATTLRDPAIVAAVNKGFIAVKVHREQQGWLTEALGITGYPTMLLAAPTGRIALWQEGYVDAATFQHQLSTMTAPPRDNSEIQPVSMNP